MSVKVGLPPRRQAAERLTSISARNAADIRSSARHSIGLAAWERGAHGCTLPAAPGPGSLHSTSPVVWFERVADRLSTEQAGDSATVVDTP